MSTLPAKKDDALQAMQDAMFDQVSSILDDHLAFAELEKDADAPPEEWIEDLGYARAWRKFRLAKYGQLPESQAPVGLKNSVKILNGLMRVKAAQGFAGAQVNIGIMIAPPDGPKPVFDVIDEDT